jgi:hypothetical protein
MNLILPSKYPYLCLFTKYQREISHCETGSDFRGIQRESFAFEDGPIKTERQKLRRRRSAERIS